MSMSEEQVSKLIEKAVTAAVSTALQEAKKPAPLTERQLAEIQQAQEERRVTAESVKEQKRNEGFIQEKVCTHFHAMREGGGTHCVLVRDNDIPQSPGFIICQKCQGRVRPDEPIMRKLDPQAIFSTELFNKLLQDCIPNGAEILSM